MGFTRAEQLVELVAHDMVKNELHLFLLRYEQACNKKPDGCTSGELHLPSVEKDFTNVTVYADEDASSVRKLARYLWRLGRNPILSS